MLLRFTTRKEAEILKCSSYHICAFANSNLEQIRNKEHLLILVLVKHYLLNGGISRSTRESSAICRYDLTDTIEV